MTVPEPTLWWGIRDSFLGYIRGAEGIVDVVPPAAGADGGFVFRYDPGSAPGVAAYRGAVRFRAHGGMLDVTIADPWIEVRPSGIELTVADGRRPGARVVVAELAPATPEPAPGLMVWADVSARLARSGTSVFGGNYPSGTELAPVQFAIPESAHPAFAG